MKKPTVKFNSNGESGNVFFVLGLCQKALRKENRIADYNTMRDRVFAASSYFDAIKIMREYVNLVDNDGEI